jgi:hypothetical protein
MKSTGAAMARPGVTYLDIAKAATHLVEQGHYPSIEAVRHVLGTGSNGTISRYLKAWREKQGNRLEAEQGLPETLLVVVKGRVHHRTLDSLRG